MKKSVRLLCGLLSLLLLSACAVTGLYAPDAAVDTGTTQSTMASVTQSTKTTATSTTQTTAAATTQSTASSIPQDTASAATEPIASITKFDYELDRYNHDLTEDELNLPTDQLVDRILEYPYLDDFWLSSSLDYTYFYECISSRFNGFAELETREDAASVMVAKLEAYPKQSDKWYYLKILLSLDVYKSQLQK